jgi:outer membrane biosynthesis protein TonB
MQKLNVPRPAVFAFCVLHFALLVLLTGCGTKARAEVIPEGPPLAVPTPPAHQVVVEQIAEAPQTEPAPEPEPAPPPKPAVTAPPPRPRVEAPAAQPTTTPQPEAPTVRVAPATASAGDERKVRDLLQKASGDLGRVDYKRLSNEGKAQYDQAKRYSDDAQQEIKERNFVYALTLAEKAATLAAELAR